MKPKLKQHQEAKTANKVSRSPLDDIKPGSEARHVQLPHDFGAKVGDSADVEYASRAAQNQDPGRKQVRSNDERGGRRDVGVGIEGGGAGAGSGGDIDLDIVGVGTHGSGVSQSGADGDPSRAANRESSRATARSKPANTTPNQAVVLPAASRNQSAEDELNAVGADAIRTDAGDDPFKDATLGEITSDDSNGTDNEEGVADNR